MRIAIVFFVLVVAVSVCILTQSAFGTVRRVPQQYPTIQAAVNAAQDDDTVLVSEGLYYENILIANKSIVVGSLYFMDGDTAHITRTVINGSQPVSPDSGSVVTMSSCIDTTTELCGFTITGGVGTIRMPGGPGSPPYPVRLGGGILCWNSSARIRANRILDNICTIDTPDGCAQGAGIASAPPFTSHHVIVDAENTIERNTAWARGRASSWQFAWAVGGGIFMACSGRIEGNRIVSNTCRSQYGYAVGAGIRTGLWGTTFVTNNDIIGNSSESSSSNSFAGGVSCSGANIVLDGNRITGNSVMSTGGSANGGGVYLDLDNDLNWAVIAGNRIRGNWSPAGTSYGGAIGMYRSSPDILNNIIDSNSATYGGAISTYENSRPRLVNNTIMSNRASLGGAIYAAHSSIHLVILNSLLWDDTASFMNNEIYLTSGAGATVQYSDVEGGWPGVGNLNGDPLLLDTTYMLSNASQCIGAGIDSVEINSRWYHAPSRCFYGGPRPNPVDSQPDVGACENPRATPTDVSEESSQLPMHFALHQNYPNPFNPSTKIGFQIADYGLVTLKVYDVLGREVATIVNEVKQPRTYTVQFDGSGLSSGVYFYRLQAGSFVDVKKFVLVK